MGEAKKQKKKPHTYTTMDGQRVKLALLNAKSLSNKVYISRDFFSTHKVDVMFLTETWLHAGKNGMVEVVKFARTLYASFFSFPRLSGRG